MRGNKRGACKGDTHRGWHHSAESKAKISAAFAAKRQSKGGDEK